ncbi:MAG: 23S rRNA (guanosine(2251)-2'-O)-methyltransferase RlmB, partial [Alphaproteobacteria bacterium]|nr:23S rRNA (guanosine(2251)-2'-O)-methyltransferase RlmB [Alphaproteobacteria bacterium]
FGRHPVLAALANPERRIFRLLLTAEAAERAAADLAALQSQPPQPEIVTRERIAERLPAGAVHQGFLAAVSPLPEAALEDLIAAAGPQALVVALDQVTDPHNVGAILRSAEAFGAAGVIVTERHAPEETGTLAKAASGALERLPLVRVVNLARALDQLKDAGFWVLGLDERADKTLADAPAGGRLVLALGAEGEGLRRLTLERCDLLLRLPMKGAMPSLNVSNAAAIALYELGRALPP